MESVASMAWNWLSPCLSSSRATLISTPSSLVFVPLLYHCSNAHHQHYWSPSSHYHCCSSPCASPMSYKWALMSPSLPPLTFALIGHTKIVSELLASCTAIVMVKLCARMRHYFHRCTSSLLQWLCDWVRRGPLIPTRMHHGKLLDPPFMLPSSTLSPPSTVEQTLSWSTHC